MEKENNTKMGNIVELLQAASFAPQKQKALLRVSEWVELGWARAAKINVRIK